MKTRAAATTLRSMLAAIVVACGGGGQQVPRERATDPAAALFNGYTRHDVNCFECHDGTGGGTKWGPSLARRVPESSDEQLRKVFVEGKGKMPAWRSQLSGAEVELLVAWLRSTFGIVPQTR
jgi:mono/diheme cytochrome c family protein